MSEHTYADFDLLIEPADEGGYRARVLHSPVGETRPVPVTIPFSPLELENFLLKVGRPRRSATRGEGSPEADAVKEFGGRLFEAVFRDGVRAALAGSLAQVAGQEDTGLRLRLRLVDSPELSDLPWEYLYDRETRRFLALSQWTPVVRYLELPRPIRPLTVRPPLRILGMAANPTDFAQLDVEAEWRNVRDALDDLEEAGRVQVDRVPTGRLADLRAALRRGEHHVFHFIGHGRYDPAVQDGMLALEGPSGRAQLLSGADVGALLSDHRSLRLVVLNSCEGARGGRTDPYAGTAQSLVYQGIPAVVAMQFEITDRAAILFAHSLYEAVADGFQLDAAMAEARNAVRGEPNPVEWATPVLYLRAPDGRIFDVTAPVTVPTPPPPPVVDPDSGPAAPPQDGGPRVEPPSPAAETVPRAGGGEQPAAETSPSPVETGPPSGPVLTPAPPGEPDGRRRKVRLLGAAAALAVLVGAAIVWWVQIRQSPGDDGDSSAGATSTSTSASAPPPPSPPALPRAASLPDDMLVVPRIVDGAIDLYLQDTGGGWRQLTRAPEIDEGPLISPDRSTIVYIRRPALDAQYEVRVMASDGTGDRSLPISNCPFLQRPAWNPADPTQLAVKCRVGDRDQLRIVRLDGTTVRVLDASADRLDDLTFSPDGSRLVYWGTDAGESTDDGFLYAVSADGSGAGERLTDDNGNADSVFSPDGSQIAYRHRNADGTSQIVVMAADGSEAAVLTSRAGTDMDPTWSPDGTRIAFKSNRDGEYPDGQIWLMDASGDGLRQLGLAQGAATHAPAWSGR
ncbi:CHAT domain-containing protein [Geodermatophilus sp. SYSU D00691]